MESTKSAFHDIELIRLGWAEPNNGRLLWEVDLKINGQVVTERYFGTWHYTDIGEKYAADSPDGRYFFVPREDVSFVIDTLHDFAPIGISCKGPSASTFRGNFYFDKWLILVHFHEIILFDLLTQQQHSLDFPNLTIWWATPLNAHQLEVSYTEKAASDRASLIITI
ncbi:MAG: hypothetical protein ACRYFX_25420 [Janthinobacterium lividum]